MANPGLPSWPPPDYFSQWPPPPPARSTADVAISIIVMILTVLACGGGAIMGLFSVAFLDYCPPESCSADRAVTAAIGTVAAAGLIGMAGLILTTVRLTTRKSGWPFAVGTLAAVIAVFFLGAFAYTAAVS